MLAQPDGCLNAAMFMIASGSINVITDIILLIFPLPLLRLLKFNKRQRSKFDNVYMNGWKEANISR